MGFDNNLTNEFKEWYFDRQNKLVERMDPKNDKELLEQAFNFYADLIIKKRELDCLPTIHLTRNTKNSGM